MKNYLFTSTVVLFFFTQYPLEALETFFCWSNFCWSHLSKEPETCSSYIYSKADIPSLEFLESGSAQAYFSSDLIKRITPFVHLIPHLRYESCDYSFCRKCGTPVLRNILSIERQTSYGETYYRCTVCHRCYCLDDWYEVKNNPVLEPIYTIDNAFWDRCSNPAIDPIYFDWHNQQYFHFFEHFLVYCNENSSCECYWPERSHVAEKIKAVVMRAVRSIFKGPLDPDDFCQRREEYPFLISRTAAGIALGLFTHTFFYSQYHQAIINLLCYADEQNDDESIGILYETLDDIRPQFLKLYDQCLELHPHPKIYYERGMAYMHLGNIESSLNDIERCIQYAEDNHQEDFLSSALYLQEGKSYAEHGYYDQAIEALTKALLRDPENRDAYFERACAYFEKGEFDQSLSDYVQSGFKNSSSENEKNISFSFDYGAGLLNGMKKGMLEEFGDGLPVWGSMMAFSLWTLNQSPIPMGKFVGAALTCATAAGAYVVANQITSELKYLVKNWNELSESQRGEMTGYLLGKYGVDIFASIGSAKLMKSYEELKKANQILNFEYALANKTVIEEIQKRYKAVEKFKKDEEYIKKIFGRKFYPEQEVRNHLQKMGYQIPEKPVTIPEHFLTCFSKKGCGISYHDPKNPNYNYVRIMPGKPHSPNPKQQKPYIIHMKNGQAINEKGEKFNSEDPKAHLDVKDFIFQ